MDRESIKDQELPKKTGNLETTQWPATG